MLCVRGCTQLSSRNPTNTVLPVVSEQFFFGGGGGGGGGQIYHDRHRACLGKTRLGPIMTYLFPDVRTHYVRNTVIIA